MRTILHSDINNCYASIECRDRPELQGQPVAVAGDPEKRHGIILAKNEVAKRCGVQTAEPIWQARKKCPALIVLPPRFDVYWQVSRQVREIYRQYTDQVEMFSIDEAWLDVTASRAVRGDGEQIAQDIRRRIRREIGVTVSVGVSFNKVFAKLASEQKKPDAVTVIPRGEFRRLVWPLPVRELLYVGPATERKLAACGIDTIGRLAGTPPEVLASLLGKMGRTLYSYANGQDQAPVRRDGESDPVKSIGQSVTTVEDLTGRGMCRCSFPFWLSRWPSACGGTGCGAGGCRFTCGTSTCWGGSGSASAPSRWCWPRRSRARPWRCTTGTLPPRPGPGAARASGCSSWSAMRTRRSPSCPISSCACGGRGWRRRWTACGRNTAFAVSSGAGRSPAGPGSSPAPP